MKNVLFLATDTHANFVNEVRLSTLERRGPVGTGMWEVVTGPVATNTQNVEVDETLGREGIGSAIVALFYKPAPPRRRRDGVRERKRLQLRRGHGHGGGDHRHAEGPSRQARPRGDGRGLRSLHVPAPLETV